MKNLKLTQSLNQKVGLRTQARNTWGPNLRAGGPGMLELQICKIKDLFGELWNFLGDSGRKLVLRKILGTFVFGNITSPPPPPPLIEIPVNKKNDLLLRHFKPPYVRTVWQKRLCFAFEVYIKLNEVYIGNQAYVPLCI